ncbi:cysteine protease family c1-related [Holotrichia oblita]|uniref:Cysteine protease family c1-related n=1 Tax=Holotrichia oblita TaxID=644536 RepID=A0ACB9TG92_HOLOL|nr:cysteine protease family c1-related [Holotrichia oblita]
MEKTVMLTTIFIRLAAFEAAIIADHPVNILINEGTENPGPIFEIESDFPTNKRNSFVDLVREQWETFKVSYNKTYTSEIEENFRMRIYMENTRIIAKHNRLYQNGMVSFSMKENKFADLLHYEFVQMMNGLRHLSSDDLHDEEASTFIAPANVDLPPRVDWRKQGAVTEVKNQGQCGSCWAFSATGSLEGQHFRKTKKLISLSEQNLVDCSERFGNQGCEGGLMTNAFKYVKANHGIDTEKSYPYEAEDDRCRYNSKNSGATDTGYKNIPSGNEKALQSAVATVGPVSVGIDASLPSFQFYSGGIYYEPECSTEEIDHGVLAVGYDSQGGHDYWIVKNSWGEDWGMQGYINMARNKENNCGIATMASYPLV